MRFAAAAVFGTLLSVSCAAPLVAQAVPLVQRGAARAALVLPADPHSDEMLAARELQAHTERMSGARLDTRTLAGDGVTAVRFGEPSYLAVRITNERLNELGTGGITAPVMLWSPRREEDLREVFHPAEQ